MLGGTIESWCIPSHNYSCLSGFEVKTVALEGGGHIWPDADDLTAYDANVDAVGFMVRHRIQPVDDYGSFTAIPEDAGRNWTPLPSSGIGVALEIPTVPPGPEALVVLFHGTGASHDSFVDVTEMTAFTQDLTANSIGWVAFSADNASGLWDLQNGSHTINNTLKKTRLFPPGCSLKRTIKSQMPRSFGTITRPSAIGTPPCASIR